MLWFRLAAVLFITSVLIWSSGICCGMIEMFVYGGATKGMIEDPTKNGTITIYVLLSCDEFYIWISAWFGLFIAFRMWRNNYQIDHSLRHLFIIWLGMWGSANVICLTICIYMIVKGKDNQENMAILYDTFQRYSQDTKFVSTLEKFQREFQCCGIYTPDDWLMLQLRQMPAAGGGGGAYQSLDYGYRQNPSTGKCHMVPPTIPPVITLTPFHGCGLKIMEEVNFRLKIYAGCCMAQIILGVISGALSWYCFFYWLEKEVIVIPEDEVSNVIIIEPESDTTIELNPDPSYLRPSAYFSRTQKPSYLPMRSNYTRNSFTSRQFSTSQRDYDGYLRPGASAYIHSHGGVNSPRSRSGPQLIHLTPEEVLKEQEQALGGKVLAEMHIEHKSTKMIVPPGGKQGHHATIALVRNKNPPKPKALLSKEKGHHGQTGNLAQDIADMSGGSARGFIEDVVIPIEPPGVKPHAIQVPIGSMGQSHHSAGRKSVVKNHEMGGLDAQNLMEGILAPEAKHPHPSAHGNHHNGNHPAHHDVDHPQLLQPIGHHEEEHHRGSHHGHYLADGGHHHEHHPHHEGYLDDRYLPDGGHHHEHHHNSRYLEDGGHHHHEHHHQQHLGHHGNQYLEDGGHHHENHQHHHGHHDRYLPAGGHHPHYLNPDRRHSREYSSSRTEHHHRSHHLGNRHSGSLSPERHHHQGHGHSHGHGHGHGHLHPRNSREIRRTTTVVFRNPKPLDDSE